MNKLVLSVLTFFLLAVLLYGCAPAPTPIVPTLTSTSIPTTTFTPSITPTSTLTITPLPSPFSTVPIDFKRVALNDFFPNLIVLIPLSFEIPEEYVMFAPEETFPPYYWGTTIDMEFIRTKDVKPDNTFFAANFSSGVGYDRKTDQFINAINDVNDTVAQEYKSQGAKVNNVERVNVGEYPVLFNELDIPYQDSAGNLSQVRKIHFVYIASLVETNVVLLFFYFSLPIDPPKDYTIWEHFENSFEGASGVGPTPLVPFITTTP